MKKLFSALFLVLILISSVGALDVFRGTFTTVGDIIITDGVLGVATSTVPSPYKLSVAGDMLVTGKTKVSTTTITSGGNLILPSYSNRSNPAFCFDDCDTGFQEHASDQISLILDGVRQWIWVTAALEPADKSPAFSLRNATTTATQPVFSFTNATTTGMGLASGGASPQLSITAGGVEGIRVASSTTDTVVKIGVATTTPAKTLAVQGDLFVSGEFKATTNTATAIKSLCYGHTDLTMTGTATTTLATCTIPANMLGTNGSIEIWSLWTNIYNGGTSRYIIQLNGNLYLYQALTGSSNNRDHRIISNRNSASSQVSFEDTIMNNNSGTAVATSTVDTTQNVTLTFAGLGGDASSSIILNDYIVRIIKP